MNRERPAVGEPGPPAVNGQPGAAPKFVRVTGTLAGRFVEFEFSIGDPSLCVALVLSFDQFQEFCDQHAVVHLTPEQAARVEFDRLKWRYGEHGVDRGADR